MAGLMGAFLAENPAFDSNTWRWVALGPIIALIPNIILLVLLARSSSRKGSLYWFMAAVLNNIVWLLVVTMGFVSNTPEQALFWYYVGALLWIPMGIFLYFFAVTYVDDTDLPPSRTLFITALLGICVLVFVAGGSNIVEPRFGSADLFWWGYEPQALDTETVVIAWLIVWFSAAIAVLIKAYRRTVNLTRKRQLRLFIFAWAQYLLIGVIGDGIIPAIIVPPPYPIINWLYSSTLSLIIGYGILKYGIFRISPVALSNTILQSLSEAVFGVNTDLKIEFSNSGAEGIIGRNQDALSGAQISSLFKPDVFERVKADIDSGKRYIEYEDINVIDKQGHSVPVNLSIGRVFDDRNKLAGYILIASNITELKRKTIELAEEKASVERKVIERTKQLSETHARLAASINSLTLGFIMTNDKDAILLMNPASKTILELFAKEQQLSAAGEWNLKSIAQVFKPGLDIISNISQTRQHSKSLEFKEVQLGERYMHVFMAPVTEKNKVIGTVILFEDITEDKIVARSKDEFFSIASHELRTPLTSIRGSAELIHDYYKDSITSADVFKMINDIQNSSSGLIEIVNDFLAMSELEQGKAVIIPEKFDLITIINDAVDAQEKLKGDKKITAKVNSSAKSIEMNHDRNKIHQVVHTFVSNAYKFTDKGSVTIDVKPSASDVTIKVSDTGKGIKPENQKLLFRKFQQAGSSLLTRDGGGTGLGLYIAKLILDVIGGEAKLETTVVGKGTTFSVTLPLVGKAPAPKLADPSKTITSDQMAETKPANDESPEKIKK